MQQGVGWLIELAKLCIIDPIPAGHNRTGVQALPMTVLLPSDAIKKKVEQIFKLKREREGKRFFSNKVMLKIAILLPPPPSTTTFLIIQAKILPRHTNV